MLKFNGIWAILAWMYLKLEDLKEKIYKIFTSIKFRK